MKVTTEGCLFGALITAENPKHILDIGAGTGLLSLMLAQKYPSAQIQAVELDENAFSQAAFNFIQSPWDKNLQIHHARIQDFVPKEKFDLIVCNPPFFKNSLRSKNGAKNLAIHEASLSQTELLDSTIGLLSNSGSFWVLYPMLEALTFRDIAVKKGLFLIRDISVRNNPASPVFRVVQQFSFRAKTPIPSELVIKNSDGSYTDMLAALFSPYYLQL